MTRVMNIAAKKMVEISRKLKERFCRDMSLSIGVMDEPYFSERLELYDKHFHCADKYNEFCSLVERFGGEQNYLTYYAKVKDAAINYLNVANPKMHEFMTRPDFDRFSVKGIEIKKNDIYHDDNHGKYFVSIDLRKANFTALHHYAPEIVDNMDTYEDFLKKFTDEPYLLGSKYIRQVIFGNVNPKRQTTYEHYLMYLVLMKLLVEFDICNIVYFATDEIVMQLKPETIESSKKTIESIIWEVQAERIDVHSEYFQLMRIDGCNGYIKTNLDTGIYSIKGVNSLDMPFVICGLYGQDYKDSYSIFEHDGKLAKLLTIPEISFGSLFEKTKKEEDKNCN